MCLASLETNTSFNTMLWSKWLRYHIDHSPVVFLWLSMWNWAVEASTLKYLWRKGMNMTSHESAQLSSLYRPTQWGNRSRKHYLSTASQTSAFWLTHRAIQAARLKWPSHDQCETRAQIQVRKYHRNNIFWLSGLNLPSKLNYLALFLHFATKSSEVVTPVQKELCRNNSHDLKHCQMIKQTKIHK